MGEDDKQELGVTCPLYVNASGSTFLNIGLPDVSSLKLFVSAPVSLRVGTRRVGSTIRCCIVAFVAASLHSLTMHRSFLVTRMGAFGRRALHRSSDLACALHSA